VIVHSQDAQIGVQGLGVSAPTLIVPHGVYDLFRLTELSRDEARDRLSRIGARPKGTLVLFFGHLESRKGLFEFLRVAERMKSEEDFSFMVSGASSLTAEERRVLHSAVDALGNVILHERRIPFEEVELHFNACDIVALPYLEGTTSGVLKLAVAFSRPVIATAVGDFPEQVTGRAGVCIPPGDRVVDDFEQALRDMRSNLPQWQTQIEATARDLSWSGIGRRIQDFLQASADA
jgi:glycosyltransferase involved in cell wall biosynthesis